MPSEQSSDVKFEIGHVLFIDIVGYSKLLIHEQSEQMQTLREIVRGTEQFRLAEAEGKLLRLPTGDGGALVFRTSPEAPVRCALEISKELKKHPELRVRMGIHSGAVNEITDLNEQANIAGAGINIAQRIMDCGDAGHILLSRHVAEDLEQYRQWQPYLHDLGECEVKHGVRVHAFNLYTDDVGNPEVPQKFKPVAGGRVGREVRRAIQVAAIAAILILDRHCRQLFSFSGNEETENVCDHISDSGKKHRGASVRKSERRKSERLLHRWRAGRDPDRPGKDRGLESHQPHLCDAIQERRRSATCARSASS